MDKTIKVLSAGGIILRKNKKGEIKALIAQNSAHKGWSFPKGHVEAGETPAAAAHREIGEEVGVKGKILEKAGITTYFYFEEGQRHFKTVIYFFMKYEGKVEATTAWEVSGVKWLPLEKVEGQLTFKDDKEMWLKALKNIKKISLDL